MPQTLRALSALVCALLPMLAGALTGDPMAGYEKSKTCSACHGADGNSVNATWPALAGQNEKYMIKQLQDFKSGKRDNAVMMGFASPLSEQDMADLAAFYAGQQPTFGLAHASLFERGRQLYHGGDVARGIPACAACHGPAGEGLSSAAFPALSGQWPEYVVAQIHLFAEGKRLNGPNGMMGGISRMLLERDIQAVADYVRALHPASSELSK